MTMLLVCSAYLESPGSFTCGDSFNPLAILSDRHYFYLEHGVEVTKAQKGLVTSLKSPEWIASA